MWCGLEFKRACWDQLCTACVMSKLPSESFRSGLLSVVFKCHLTEKFEMWLPLIFWCKRGVRWRFLQKELQEWDQPTVVWSQCWGMLINFIYWLLPRGILCSCSQGFTSSWGNSGRESREIWRSAHADWTEVTCTWACVGFNYNPGSSKFTEMTWRNKQILSVLK